MIAEHESTSRTSGHGPQMSIGGHALADFDPVAPPELNRQPPAAPPQPSPLHIWSDGLPTHRLIQRRETEPSP